MTALRLWRARRAAAHRAMARAALFSDSSLSVRRNRYNYHIGKARQAEARAFPAGKLNADPSAIGSGQPRGGRHE